MPKNKGIYRLFRTKAEDVYKRQHWNDRLDIDNHAIMGKMIVDAMKGRVIEDDSRRWVKGVCHYFHDGDYISVEIREIS